jgi:phosphoglycolate phosphatase
MIGDSATDVAAARNSGIPVVVVSYGYRQVPVEELGADAVILDMRELPAELTRLWNMP